MSRHRYMRRYRKRPEVRIREIYARLKDCAAKLEIEAGRLEADEPSAAALAQIALSGLRDVALRELGAAIAALPGR